MLYQRMPLVVAAATATLVQDRLLNTGSSPPKCDATIVGDEVRGATEANLHGMTWPVRNSKLNKMHKLKCNAGWDGRVGLRCVVRADGTPGWSVENASDKCVPYATCDEVAEFEPVTSGATKKECESLLLTNDMKSSCERVSMKCRHEAKTVEVDRVAGRVWNQDLGIEAAACYEQCARVSPAHAKPGTAQLAIGEQVRCLPGYEEWKQSGRDTVYFVGQGQAKYWQVVKVDYRGVKYNEFYAKDDPSITLCYQPVTECPPTVKLQNDTVDWPVSAGQSTPFPIGAINKVTCDNDTGFHVRCTKQTGWEYGDLEDDGTFYVYDQDSVYCETKQRDWTTCGPLTRFGKLVPVDNLDMDEVDPVIIQCPLGGELRPYCNEDVGEWNELDTLSYGCITCVGDEGPMEQNENGELRCRHRPHRDYEAYETWQKGSIDFDQVLDAQGNQVGKCTDVCRLQDHAVCDGRMMRSDDRQELACVYLPKKDEKFQRWHAATIADVNGAPVGKVTAAGLHAPCEEVCDYREYCDFLVDWEGLKMAVKIDTGVKLDENWDENNLWTAIKMNFNILTTTKTYADIMGRKSALKPWLYRNALALIRYIGQQDDSWLETELKYVPTDIVLWFKSDKIKYLIRKVAKKVEGYLSLDVGGFLGAKDLANKLKILELLEDLEDLADEKRLTAKAIHGKIKELENNLANNENALTQKCDLIKKNVR